MNLFFDTSALVKYFHAEIGTEQVVTLMDHPGNQIWISDLAKIEFISAIHLKFRRNDLNSLQLERILSAFDFEISQMNILPLNDAVIVEADRLIRKKAKRYGLRTLDSIQLASFTLLSEEDWAFVVADAMLADVALSEKLTVIRIAL